MRRNVVFFLILFFISTFFIFPISEEKIHLKEKNVLLDTYLSGTAG